MFIDFRERGRGWRERERDIDVRNIDGLPSIRARTEDQTHNLGMCPNWKSKMLQPTELHWPGLRLSFYSQGIQQFSSRALSLGYY